MISHDKARELKQAGFPQEKCKLWHFILEDGTEFDKIRESEMDLGELPIKEMFGLPDFHEISAQLGQRLFFYYNPPQCHVESREPVKKDFSGSNPLYGKPIAGRTLEDAMANLYLAENTHNGRK